MNELQILIFLVSLHVLLLFISATTFYMLLLALWQRKGTEKHILVIRAAVSFVSILGAWVVSILYLSDYYVGKEGFVTSAKDISTDISTLVPTFVYIREILLPLLFVASLILLLFIFWKGGQLKEKPKYNKILIPLTIISFIIATILTFLGVLIP